MTPILWPPASLQFRLTDDQIGRLFRHHPAGVSVEYRTAQERCIRMVRLCRDHPAAIIVFIHGAPGSSADFFTYFFEEKLYGKAGLLSIDRPGYGFSDFGKPASIDEQAALIAEVLRPLKKNRRMVLVCHSYGGPVGASIAMRYPELVDALILLAPAIDPEQEIIWWVARIGAAGWTGRILPKALRMAAYEKMRHKDDLRAMAGEWQQMKVHVCHVHGTRDHIVPFENLAFSVKNLDPRYLEAVTLKGAGHFLPWTRKQQVMEIIGRYLPED
jgi:pimeloyl-ACP methyl ester carboxylesterase